MSTDVTRGAPAEPIRFAAVHQSDPLAETMLDELGREYHSRYGDLAGTEYADLRTYPAEQFAPPTGALILALSGETPVAGGAFRRYDETTAELGCVHQGGVRVGPDQRYRRVVAE
mgnify:CR=1 FL=1